MKMKHLAYATLLMGVAVGAAQASPLTLQQATTITMPDKPLMGFDTGYVDQKSGLFFLADRSNSAVDIIDVATAKYVGRVGGFAGFHGDFDTAGPSGFAAVHGLIWASDGDSTIKVIDPVAQKIVSVIALGGQKRADEMTYDAKDQIVAVESDADTPPMLSLISTKPGYKILAQLKFPHATGGLDAPDYDAGTGMIYVSVPNLDNSNTQGAVAVVNPRTAKVTKMFPIDNCAPAGSAFGPNGNFVLACDAGSADSKMPPLALVMNKNGATVAKITQIGGADQVAYDPQTEQYYLAAANLPSGSVLGIIDAKTNEWVENVPTGGHSHAVAVDVKDSRVLVPRPVKGGNCGTSGCIAVYETTAQ